MKYLEVNYNKWITEAKAPNTKIRRSDEEISKEVEEARRKVEKCVMWININMGFYAELLSHLAIYGVYDYARMFTDCKTYIAYDPHFVVTHKDEEIRAVFLHETLHVIAQHNEREGHRDHEVWGKACDLAINPIIKSESRYGKFIYFPTIEIDGKKIENVLYEERFDGMRAEDIYDVLVEEGEKTGEDLTEREREAIRDGDMGDEEFEPVPGSMVQEPLEEEYVDPDEGKHQDPSGPGGPGGQEEEEEESQPKPGSGQPSEEEGDTPGSGGAPGKPTEGQGEPAEGQGGEGGEGTGVDANGKPIPGKASPDGKPIPATPGKGPKVDPIFNKEVRKGGIPTGEQEANRVSRANNEGDLLKGDANAVKSGGKSKVLRRKMPNWASVKQGALARSGSSLSEKTRKLILSSLGDVAVVDWENELRKWYDHCLSGRETVLPNKRLLSSGMITYGTKKTGLSGLKTIVAAVDTSGSISEDQKKTFLNEVAYLAKKHNSDRLVIIYCSDDIDGVQVVKKGQKIDLSVMKSTGGNKEGFIPPFKWCYENHVKPSVFIYLTDTGGLMPDKETYNIRKYMNKVIWFICSPTIYNPPPFGKCIFMPVGSIKEKGGRHGKVEKL